MADLSRAHLFAATRKGPFKLSGPFKRVKIGGNDFIAARKSFPGSFGMWAGEEFLPVIDECCLFSDFHAALEYSRRMLDEVISDHQTRFARTLEAHSS